MPRNFSIPLAALEGVARGGPRPFFWQPVLPPSGLKTNPSIDMEYFRMYITGLDLEKQLRETGAVLRPSDHTFPSSIAFIQCVGSRDLHLNHPFCSQVCCAYALRMANLIKHKTPQTEITFFYMDLQTFGKDFPLFLERAEKQIRFIRAIPGEIQKGENDQVLLTFQDDSGTSSRKEAFDLAVLSIGIMPGTGLEFFMEKLGMTLNKDGFLVPGE